MKTIRKIYIRKRKTTKKRARKNRYLLKGGAPSLVKSRNIKLGEVKPAEQQKPADKKEDGDVKEGDVILDDEGNTWTFKEDPVLGPVYYSVWTHRGEPLYVWAVAKFKFFKGGFKKQALEFFMSVNPTAIMMQTAFDTGVDLMKKHGPEIEKIIKSFTSAFRSGPAMPGAIPGAIPTMPAISVHSGGGKRKRRKFTKRRK